MISLYPDYLPEANIRLWGKIEPQIISVFFHNANAQHSVINYQAYPTHKTLYLKSKRGIKKKQLAIETNLLKIQIVELSDIGFKTTANYMFRKTENS